MKKNDLLIKHLIITNSYYEKKLLEKKIIDLGDIYNTRQKIQEGITEKDYNKLINAFCKDDGDYHTAKLELVKSGSENGRRIRAVRWLIKDQIYNRALTFKALQEHVDNLRESDEK